MKTRANEARGLGALGRQYRRHKQRSIALANRRRDSPFGRMRIAGGRAGEQHLACILDQRPFTVVGALTSIGTALACSCPRVSNATRRPVERPNPVDDDADESSNLAGPSRSALIGARAPGDAGKQATDDEEREREREGALVGSSAWLLPLRYLCFVCASSARSAS